MEGALQPRAGRRRRRPPRRRQSVRTSRPLRESNRFAPIFEPLLRSEFLADKRDVYDALIALRLSAPAASAADLFELVEHSRARTWQDRLQPDVQPLSLRDVQSKIPPDTLLLEPSAAVIASRRMS